MTAALVPSAVGSIHTEMVNPDSMVISWKQPTPNGSPVTSYNIDLAEATKDFTQNNEYLVVTSRHQNCEYRIQSLIPDTVYK